jgi:hypothetical protein
MAALLKPEHVELDDLASRRQEVEESKTYRKWGRGGGVAEETQARGRALLSTNAEA